MTFTDLLAEYIEAKNELDRVREKYDGYSFGYFREIEREDKARNALNAYVATLQQPKDQE